MNLQKLKEAEGFFLRKYPEGFQDPEMLAIGKKHKMEQMINFAQDNFKKSKFKNTTEIAENMVKQVSRASMVSMFEKPKFRDFVPALEPKERSKLIHGLKELLHGNQQKGFEAMVEVMKPAKLAKWSLVTIIPNYFAPDEEVFVKPTTAKGVINYFELDGLEYKPTPTWDFYQRYREAILNMKEHIAPELQPNNAAFCGFLMMSM